MFRDTALTFGPLWPALPAGPAGPWEIAQQIGYH